MRKSAGFTVVELIVICVVLGILVSIGTVAWSATSNRSTDRTLAAEQQAWLKQFETYRQRFNVYPNANSSGVAITGDHCLGTGFASGRCKGGATPVTENASSAIMLQLAKVGTAPDYSRKGAINGYSGPWVSYATAGEIRIYQSYKQTECPEDTTKDTAFTTANICYVRMVKN